MPNTVITYGTFDLFHIGHLRLLQRAKELGDRLIVAVSTDEFNHLKGKKCIIPYRQRAEIIQNIRCVDLVIPEHNWEQKVQDVKTHHVNTFVIGADWKGKFDFLSGACNVVYLKRTSDISTTDLKQNLKSILSVNAAQITQMLEILQQLKDDLE